MIWRNAVVGLTLVCSGCSLLSAEVGPAQGSCAAAGNVDAGGSGNAYAPAATMQGSATCGIDAGSACDDCESKWCCAQRVACYSDPVCACADSNLDSCRSWADASSAGECWDTFASEGTVESTRVACLTAWCAGVCSIP
jgi:hypothetical protein